MNKEAFLALEDGSIYQGYSFGAEADASGEVVFCTSMVGYQEMLTDPSYAGQILVPTYPLIGNYGVNEQDFESAKIQVRGFVVREQCLKPSHYMSQKTIHEYLAQTGIPGIYGVDTRMITRRLRSAGVMMGMITRNKTPQQAIEELRKVPSYGTTAGTHAFLKSQGTPSEPILKEHEGRPNITDAIKNKEIQLVINTPAGKLSKYDDSYIRKAAIKCKVPYITTLAAAMAAARGIAAYHEGKLDVKSLQSYHAGMK